MHLRASNAQKQPQDACAGRGVDSLLVMVEEEGARRARRVMVRRRRATPPAPRGAELVGGGGKGTGASGVSDSAKRARGRRGRGRLPLMCVLPGRGRGGRRGHRRRRPSQSAGSKLFSGRESVGAGSMGVKSSRMARSGPPVDDLATEHLFGSTVAARAEAKLQKTKMLLWRGGRRARTPLRRAALRRRCCLRSVSGTQRTGAVPTKGSPRWAPRSTAWRRQTSRP